jgi:hypothetical protein
MAKTRGQTQPIKPGNSTVKTESGDVTINLVKDAEGKNNLKITAKSPSRIVVAGGITDLLPGQSIEVQPVRTDGRPQLDVLSEGVVRPLETGWSKTEQTETFRYFFAKSKPLTVQSTDKEDENPQEKRAIPPPPKLDGTITTAPTLIPPAPNERPTPIENRPDLPLDDKKDQRVAVSLKTEKSPLESKPNITQTEIKKPGNTKENGPEGQGKNAARKTPAKESSPEPAQTMAEKKMETAPSQLAVSPAPAKLEVELAKPGLDTGEMIWETGSRPADLTIEAPTTKVSAADAVWASQPPANQPQPPHTHPDPANEPTAVIKSITSAPQATIIPALPTPLLGDNLPPIKAKVEDPKAVRREIAAAKKPVPPPAVRPSGPRLKEYTPKFLESEPLTSPPLEAQEPPKDPVIDFVIAAESNIVMPQNAAQKDRLTPRRATIPEAPAPPKIHEAIARVIPDMNRDGADIRDTPTNTLDLAASPDRTGTGQEILKPGDKLKVVDRTTKNIRAWICQISRDGILIVPSGQTTLTFAASGRTLADLALEIKAKTGYQTELSAQEARTFTVLGAVKNQGTKTLAPNAANTNILRAIAAAGGLRPDADPYNILVTRAGTVYRVDLSETIGNGNTPHRIYPGDRIEVKMR